MEVLVYNYYLCFKMYLFIFSAININILNKVIKFANVQTKYCVTG